MASQLSQLHEGDNHAPPGNPKPGPADDEPSSDEDPAPSQPKGAGNGVISSRTHRILGHILEYARKLGREGMKEAISNSLKSENPSDSLIDVMTSQQPMTRFHINQAYRYSATNAKVRSTVVRAIADSRHNLMPEFKRRSKHADPSLPKPSRSLSLCPTCLHCRLRWLQVADSIAYRSQGTIAYILQPVAIILLVAVFVGILLMKDYALNHVALLFILPTGIVILQLASIVEYTWSLFKHYRHNRLAGSGTALEALVHAVLRCCIMTMIPAVVALFIAFSISRFTSTSFDTLGPLLVVYLSTFLNVISLSCFSAAACPTSALAATVATIIISHGGVFSGFIVPRSNLPGVFSWIPFTSYHYYSFLSMMNIWLGDKAFPCAAGDPFSCASAEGNFYVDLYEADHVDTFLALGMVWIFTLMWFGLTLLLLWAPWTTRSNSLYSTSSVSEYRPRRNPLRSAEEPRRSVRAIISELHQADLYLKEMDQKDMIGTEEKGSLGMWSMLARGSASATTRRRLSTETQAI